MTVVPDLTAQAKPTHIDETIEQPSANGNLTSRNEADP